MHEWLFQSISIGLVATLLLVAGCGGGSPEPAPVEVTGVSEATEMQAGGFKTEQMDVVVSGRSFTAKNVWPLSYEICHLYCEFIIIRCVSSSAYFIQWRNETIELSGEAAVTQLGTAHESGDVIENCEGATWYTDRIALAMGANTIRIIAVSDLADRAGNIMADIYQRSFQTPPCCVTDKPKTNRSRTWDRCSPNDQ